MGLCVALRDLRFSKPAVARGLLRDFRTRIDRDVCQPHGPSADSAYAVSPLMAARTIAPTILSHAAHFLVAVMILSELAVLLQHKTPETKSKLIAVLAGINQRVETYGLVLVSIATISFGLSVAWLAGG